MPREKQYTEGRTTFLSADVEYYSGDKKQITAGLPVFYNSRMRLNRDISVLFLSSYLAANSVKTICEPLTGSGVRTLRYLNECPGNFNAKMFDVNFDAVEIAAKNVKLLGLEKRAHVIRGDARLLLLTESRDRRFDYVDVDPFGTPAPYLNAAIQSLSPHGGLLAITATDMPVLCGGYQNVAMRRYGGFPVKSPFVHEIAVRLLQGFAFRIAGINDQSITPIAILSTDHYIRTWIKVDSNRRKSNRQSRDLGTIRYCKGCMQTETVPQTMGYDKTEFVHASQDCKGPVQTAGPLWIGDLFEVKHLERARNIFSRDDANYYHQRVARILDEMVEENSLIAHPFIDLHALCDLHSLTPPKNTEVIGQLASIGYRAVRTHFKPTAIRTDAPLEEVVSAIKSLNQG
jgi:tRNA (guanine26-N2/guanine27-N2)-dimethyltransferase